MRTFKVIVILAGLLMTAPYGLCDGLKVTQEGDVGIGTATPQAKLEVNGDILVNGTIKQSSTAAYADWYVGNYYSIPADQRSADADITIDNLSQTWTTVDLSTHPLLPQGAKRVKIYIDITGVPGVGGGIILQTRPFGANSGNNYFQNAKCLINAAAGSQPRIGVEIEVDIADGKFELREYHNSWPVGLTLICLRGFYM